MEEIQRVIDMYWQLGIDYQQRKATQRRDAARKSAKEHAERTGNFRVEELLKDSEEYNSVLRFSGYKQVNVSFTNDEFCISKGEFCIETMTSVIELLILGGTTQNRSICVLGNRWRAMVDTHSLILCNASTVIGSKIKRSSVRIENRPI